VARAYIVVSNVTRLVDREFRQIKVDRGCFAFLSLRPRER